jgi:hypothetical protein
VFDLLDLAVFNRERNNVGLGRLVELLRSV